MILIQLLLVVAVLASLVYVLANPHTQRARAGKKLLFLLFVVFTIIAIIWPEITNELAHFVGVGRGADLLTYGLAVAFIALTVSTYIKFQSQRAQLIELARQQAITEARQTNADKLK